jgi:hypothetical protein
MQGRFVHFVVLYTLLFFHFSLPAQWTTYAPMPSARWGNNTIGHNGLLYSISGNGSNANEVYDPATNTWSTLAPNPTSASYFAISAWGGRIYVMGGATASSVWLNTNQIYDIATNTWSSGAVMPTNCMGAVSVAYNGRIYLAGGWNGGLLNILQIYDIATNSWTAGAASPTSRNQGASGLIGSIMYVFGGFGSSPVNTLEAYNILTNTWQTRTGMNAARYIFAGASDGSLLHAAGGFPPVSGYETYDPGTNLWTTRASLNQGRYRTSGSVANGCFFVVGGFNGSVTVATNEGTCGLLVLPVNASLHLAAQAHAASVQLTWQPLPGDPAARWEIQRSPDGLRFETIAQHISTGNYWDETPSPGSNYYRLVGYDQNGEQVQSEMALVELEGQEEMHFAYVNATLEFHPDATVAGRAALYDLAGKRLLEATLPARPEAASLRWSLASFPAGIYVFTYISGTQQFRRKIVKGE